MNFSDEQIELIVQRVAASFEVRDYRAVRSAHARAVAVEYDSYEAAVPLKLLTRHLLLLALPVEAHPLSLDPQRTAKPGHAYVGDASGVQVLVSQDDEGGRRAKATDQRHAA